MIRKNANAAPNVKEAPNPFRDMSILGFYAFTFVFFFTFPWSFLVIFIFGGKERTIQLIRALITDFLQTLLIIVIAASLMIWGLYSLLAAIIT